ncbi:MAG: DUF4249 domain-containing protein [Bacteroidia bacterium]|jgi:hypothetical protein|tara:strand:+ start:3566 stop:4375 length:810 start_codon:yes stop_codon:yes gene_type:complete
MKKTIILLVVLVLAGCQTVLEDVTVPAAEVKAVVFYSANNFGGFANPLLLTKTKPVLNSSVSGDFEKIENAVISLTGNGQEVNFINMNNDYVLNNRNFRFSAGIEYSLSIVTPENGTVSGKSSMPDSISEYRLEVDSIDQPFDVIFNGRLSIPDNPTKDEYYRIEAFSRYDGSDEVMYVDGEYFSDENAANGSVNTRFTTRSWDDKNGKRPEVYVILSAITKDHYEYGKALENYDPENPFSEPTPLPNNVEGGLGIFTLSNSQIIRIKQ